MKKIFICADVWFGVFACFGRAELGLKLALLSWRFDALVDEHFRGRKWSLGVVEIRHAKIRRAENATGPKGVVSRHRWKLGSNAEMFIKYSWCIFKRVEFLHTSPPNLIGFKRIIIRLGRHIDIKVIALLSSIRHLFNADIILELNTVYDVDPAWPAIAQEIWPLSCQSIDTLILWRNGISMLRNLVSPSVLRDCPNLRRIVSNHFPDAVPDDRASADISKAVSMWLHTPRPDGRPKVLVYGRPRFEYQGRLADIKRTFANASSSPVSYVKMDERRRD
uniref:F-box domain-containing protein n=1 Tax=Globodera pallida TaxID=36090 RepID=A0A183BSA6_GLOPA